MIMSSTSVISFSPKHVLKHSKQGRELDDFEYWAYSDPKLCVSECVKEYIHRRNVRVDKEQKGLFITYRKSYHSASIDTIQRWIKETFAETNLTENFTPLSCRSASTTNNVMFLYIEFSGINIEYARHKVTFTQINDAYY